MNIDWPGLSSVTDPYRSIEVTRDTNHAALSVTFAGASIKLSELNSIFGDDIGTVITVFADTLIIDEPALRARGFVVMARSIDTTALHGPLAVPISMSETSVVELLVGQFVGSPLQLIPKVHGDTDPVTVPAGTQPLRALLYTIDHGKGTTEVQESPDDLNDLIDRPYALSSLKAGFAAAAELMYSTSASNRLVAQSIYNWIIRTCFSLESGGKNAIPGEYGELRSQSASLLVMLNVESGALYVPVLSSSYYQKEISLLLDTLGQYEADAATLAVKTGIDGAIANVAAALQSVANTEKQPLQAQLESIQSNLASLSDEIVLLRRDFDGQFIHASTLFTELEVAVIQKEGKELLSALFSFGMDAVKSGVDVAKIAASDGVDFASIGDLVGNMISAGKSAKTAIDAAHFETPGNSDLAKNLEKLIESQQKIIDSLRAGGVVWAHEHGKAEDQDLPKSLGAIEIDPALAWDNYMVEAKTTLANIKISIGDDSGDAQKAANNYLAELEILAQYGKSIAAKIITYASLLSQATLVKTRIDAAETIEKRWKELEADAKTDAEKLAALVGIIETRQDSIKRSIFESWLHYRNAYLFLYFDEPPIEVNLHMDAATLKEKLADVSVWIAKLLGDDPDGHHIQLPDENVDIELEFDICTPDQPAIANDHVAILTLKGPEANATPRLTWTVPYGTDQLQGVLPNDGNVAIWIQEAQFFVIGVHANQKSRVIASISTSGTYENGLSPDHVFTFVNKSMRGNYGYEVDADGKVKVYDAWTIDADVYAMPTLYTQWRMVFDPHGGNPAGATKLQMKLKVAFRAAERNG